MSQREPTLKRFPSGFVVAGLLVLSGLMWAVMFLGPLAHLTHLAGGRRLSTSGPKAIDVDGAELGPGLARRAVRRLVPAARGLRV